MSAYSQVLVIGAGAFGAASALELAQLGHHVTVVDPSLDGFASESAASHDLNKIVRADYTVRFGTHARMHYIVISEKKPLICGVRILCMHPTTTKWAFFSVQADPRRWT